MFPPALCLDVRPPPEFLLFLPLDSSTSEEFLDLDAFLEVEELREFLEFLFCEEFLVCEEFLAARVDEEFLEVLPDGLVTSSSDSDSSSVSSSSSSEASDSSSSSSWLSSTLYVLFVAADNRKYYACNVNLQ